MLKSVRAYIRERDLMRAGERIAVAVSGGADSVALLRVLLELRAELGIVLSVAHVNHGLRGTDALRDAEFAGELARAHGLEFHLAVRDVAAYAAEHKLGVEAAGRRVRYEFFAELVAGNRVDKIATAHTLDDQAETVLLKMLRGAWLRGLGGIHDKISAANDDGDRQGRVAIIRPLLCVKRPEVLAYLKTLSQPWREDASNEDPGFTRNRVRKLLPRLEREYNPAIREALAQMAELARAEEAYWAEEMARLAPRLISFPGADGFEIDALGVAGFPLAVQRRVLREAGRQAGLGLDFDKVERLRTLLTAGSGSQRDLSAGWQARKYTSSARTILRLERTDAKQSPAADYAYRLYVPGEVSVPEARCLIRATVVPVVARQSRDNLLDAQRLGSELLVRNWHAGDRYLPLGEHREKKLKSYFQQHGIEPGRRLSLPLIFSNGRLAWVCGMPVAADFAWRENPGSAVRIEALPLQKV